jgi:hypothetical protein
MLAGLSLRLGGGGRYFLPLYWKVNALGLRICLAWRTSMAFAAYNFHAEKKHFHLPTVIVTL